MNLTLGSFLKDGRMKYFWLTEYYEFLNKGILKSELFSSLSIGCHFSIELQALVGQEGHSQVRILSI